VIVVSLVSSASFRRRTMGQSFVTGVSNLTATRREIRGLRVKGLHLQGSWSLVKDFSALLLLGGEEMNFAK